MLRIGSVHVTVLQFFVPQNLYKRLEIVSKAYRNHHEGSWSTKNIQTFQTSQTSQTFYWQLDALWTRVFHNCCDGCPIPMERSSQRVWNDRVQRVLIPRLSIAKNRQVDIAESTSRYCQIHLSILWIPNIVLSATKITFFSTTYKLYKFRKTTFLSTFPVSSATSATPLQPLQLSVYLTIAPFWWQVADKNAKS